jgi:hypothetical protein
MVLTVGDQWAKLIVVLILGSLLVSLQSIAAVMATDNYWVTKESMQQARSDLGVATVNGKIYAIGGNTENGYVPNTSENDYKALGWIVATNEEYDTETNTWAFKKPMPTPRCNFGIVVYQNKIYCIGGITNIVGDEISFTGVNEVYDPATDTWETKASMPNSTSAQANVVDGKIYLIDGGCNGNLNQAYNPVTDSWTIKEPMPVAIGSDNPPPNTLSTLVSTVVDDKIYLMSFSVALSLNWKATIEIYNPENNTWSLKESSPSNLLEGGNWWSQAAVATTGVMAPEQIHIFFAKYPLYSTNLPNTLTYNASTDDWAVEVEAPTSRQNFGVVVLNDTLYVIGGRSYDYPLSSDNYFYVTAEAVNEQYIPIGYIPEFPSWVLLSLLLVATVLTILYKKRLTRNSPHSY